MKTKYFFILTILFIIQQLNCQEDSTTDNEDDYCSGIQPVKDIKEYCLFDGKMNNGKTCCYMTTKYEECENYSCIALKKNSKTIKDEIKRLKNENKDIKSININCNTYFINLSHLFLIVIVLFFF